MGIRSLPKVVVRALGLVNPLMRELGEMSYEFEEPFVLDTSKFESTFGSSGTSLATAIAVIIYLVPDAEALLTVAGWRLCRDRSSGISPKRIECREPIWQKEVPIVTAKHVAWFRFKDGVDDDRIEEHMRAVRGLADLVPAVSAIECGKSYTDRAGGLTHCIIVTLPDRTSLPRYLEHPAHVPIAEALVSYVAELRVMDLHLSLIALVSSDPLRALSVVGDADSIVLRGGAVR